MKGVSADMRQDISYSAGGESESDNNVSGADGLFCMCNAAMSLAFTMLSLTTLACCTGDVNLCRYAVN